MELLLGPALQWKHLLPRMINLSARSHQKELLDNDAIPFADIQQNMIELNTINTLLGGHSITISGLQKIISCGGMPKKISICEIGCGGGDNLLALQHWCAKQQIDATFTGIDIQAACIEFAKEHSKNLSANWIVADYADVKFIQPPDIIFSSLFCHHFSSAQLIEMLQWMKKNAAKGFFINDLHRHPLAYYSIKIITRIFSGSYLVKNDAPLSVARAFKKNDWQELFLKSGIQKYTVQWKWAFRYLIVHCNE